MAQFTLKKEYFAVFLIWYYKAMEKKLWCFCSSAAHQLDQHQDGAGNSYFPNSEGNVKNIS